jgi:hypothetical protein
MYILHCVNIEPRLWRTANDVKGGRLLGYVSNVFNLLGLYYHSKLTNQNNS